MNYLSVAKEYKIPYSKTVSPKNNCNWDGKKMNIKGLKQHSICHEISHWILAPKSRRLIPEYGLGSGPNSNQSTYIKALNAIGKVDYRMEYSKSMREEIETCVLEFCITAFCGKNLLWSMKDRNFIITDLYKHKTNLVWESPNIADDFVEIINQLKAKRIINKDWIPVKLVKYSDEDSLKRMIKFKKFVSSLNG